MSADRRRSPGEVIGAAVLAGVIAGFAIGVVDATAGCMSGAGQFVPHFITKVRFVLFSGFTDAAAGWVIGLLLGAVIVVMSRGTRLGDLVRFAWRDHATRRAREPRQAVAGLALALAVLPCVGIALVIAYKLAVPFLANRHVVSLEVIVAMSATLGALIAAVPLTFLVQRPLEWALQRVAKRLPRLASPWAPFVAIGLIVTAALVVWAKLQWDTAKLLPLRGPFVLILGLAFAIPALGPARRAVAFLAPLFVWFRRAVWLALPAALFGLVLLFGSSASIIKAANAYSGLGGPIVHQLRRLLDRDHDGFSGWLGGGDCDDHDASVHPGAKEIPDNGIDDNCVGGDASVLHPYKPEGTAFAPVPATVPKDFNILLITIDTTRADHLTPYGYERDTSPNLDKLAKDGTLFENGWAHAPSTRYSMPAIMTGRLPLDVYYDYAVKPWPGIALKATTLAESLQLLGFATGAITNFDYFDRNHHYDQGFAEYDNEDARLHQNLNGPERSRGSSSKQQSDKAIAFVDHHAADRWFLWVHYYDPHAEYEKHMEKSFGDSDLDRYDGEIWFTDLHIGRVIAELKAKGLYDKTVIVVTGDHGEGFGEHGIYMHGYQLYAAQTKVPLIMRVPGLAPHHATTPAGHTDIMPTLVDLAGGTATTEMMGRSLVDVLADPTKDFDRTIFQQLSYENNNEMRGAVSRGCHVIYNISPDNSWELYKDPEETEDLSGYDDQCTETVDNFKHWYDSTTIPAEAKVEDPHLTEHFKIEDPHLAERFRIGDAVSLLAVDAPAQVHAGGIVDLTWTFKALGTPLRGYKLFVHVDGPQPLNSDRDPDRPFSLWKAGDFIRYTQSFAAGAPGRYVIHAGMYMGETRLPVTGPEGPVANNEAPVASFEVVP